MDRTGLYSEIFNLHLRTKQGIAAVVAIPCFVFCLVIIWFKGSGGFHRLLPTGI